MNDLPKSTDVLATASLWAVRLAEGELTDLQRCELDAWLALDAKHVGALVRARASWLRMDQTIAAKMAELPLAARPVAALSRWRTFALAASFAAAVLISVAATYQHFAERLVSQPGEVRRIVLDDGSTVALNTSSVIQVRYQENERHVLLRKGEASFDVAHDPQRPFIVSAGGLAVRAVGTSFVVSLGDQNVAVTVAEGVVEVQRPETGEAARKRLLRQDRELVVGRSGAIVSAKTLTPEEISQRLAWREGLLVFRGEQLGAAVAQVNRYTSTPVIIDDRELARESFFGVFRVGDARAFARTAAVAFNADLVERTDGLHLSRRKNSAAQ